VNTSPFSGRRAALALLAALLFLSAGRTGADDIKKEISDVERQILEIKKKLDELRRGGQIGPAPGAVPDSVLARMNWRCIGPANMGGRVTAVAVVESDPTTYYVATASGGLLKTTNNGTTFSFVFEKQATISIGDVAVAPSDPNVVYVGTGENNPRNSVSYGDGVYKSTNGGKDWQNVGLTKTISIGKIVVHPKDPNTVYVAALGRLYGPNAERGVFKTTDGGRTWDKVLFVDDKTGAIELRMDPTNPDVLLAGLWERKRDEFDGFFVRPWPGPDQYGPIVSHGPGGGLFKTDNGGRSWKKLTGEKPAPGLPSAKTGRIGLDYSRKTKGLVYAIIDTEEIGKGRPALAVYLGITAESAKGGARLKDVLDDGSLGKGGLKSGDLITRADDTKIESFENLLDFMVPKKPDDTVKFTATRGKETVTATVKLLPAKAAPPPKKGFQTLSPGGLVFTVTSNDDEVKVTEVPKDGAAEKAGVKAGMLVVAVDGKAVTNWREFRTELRVGFKATNPRKAGDKVTIAFKDGDKKGFDVALALEQAEVRGGGGGRQNTDATRPFLMSGVVGGQQANVQNDQGKDGYQTGGVYMSKDNGDTWARVNSVNPRPFYFSNVRVDPTDDNVIYVLGDTVLWKSTDAGKSFNSARADVVHPDHHALWIDPKDGRHMLLGCDGGFYKSYDRGATWDHLNVLALGQFYHVAVDNRKPYRVYGGLQDNGSWGGPSRTLRGTGPANEDWQFLRGGDGFVCRVDPNDPDWIYAESQNGGIGRINLKTGEERGIGAPQVKPGEPLRYNWNTPFILSSHNSHIFYSGAQYLFRSVARGDKLKAISPELTRTKAGTLTAIAESPKNADVLWAGTDDGYLWVTKDGGQNWSNAFDGLKKAGLPGPRHVASIEPSRKVEGRCYVCLDAHRSDDDKPYLFKTEDYGQTWTPLTANLPAFGSTRVLREDAVNPDLLYCGTEFGIWVSINRGESWARLNNNLPSVAVHEIAQPTTASEIVIATHGRSVWVLDVASLRQLTPKLLGDTTTFFAPAAITRWQFAPGSFPYSRDTRKFYGTNPAPGGGIDYLLVGGAKEVTLKVLDVKGKEVPRRILEVNDKAIPLQAQGDVGKSAKGNLALPAAAGFHRAQLAIARAGAYKLVLVIDGKEFEQMITVENDPNAPPNAVLSEAPRPAPGGDEDEADDIAPFIPKAED